MHCMLQHTNENIWMNCCLRMLSRCFKIICRADNPCVMDVFTFLLLTLSRPRFYNCSAAYWNLPVFLRNSMDGTQWVPWRPWGLALGCLVKRGLEVDQGKGTGWVYKCCFLSSPPLWHSPLNQRLDLCSDFSYFKPLNSLCSFFYMSHKAQFTSRVSSIAVFLKIWSRAPCMETSGVFSTNADTWAFPDLPTQSLWRIHIGNLF